MHIPVRVGLLDRETGKELLPDTVLELTEGFLARFLEGGGTIPRGEVDSVASCVFVPGTREQIIEHVADLGL